MAKQKIKVMHIAECAGGVDKYLEMLIPLLMSEFEQVFVCSQNYDVSKYNMIADKVCQIEMYQTFKPILILRQVRQLRRMILEFRPDIVYCHSSFAGGLGRLACIGIGCKIVYNPHGWAFNMC